MGNCCKVATVTINCLIWDLHASPAGIAFLLLSLACAFFYKQAPMRTTVSNDNAAHHNSPQQQQQQQPLLPSYHRSDGGGGSSGSSGTSPLLPVEKDKKMSK